MMGWGFLAAIMSTFNLARFLDRGQTIVRAYILFNRTVIRLELGRGQILDIPISGLNLKSYNKMAGILSVSANGKSLQFKMKNASYLDPVLIYAITQS